MNHRLSVFLLSAGLCLSPGAAWAKSTSSTLDLVGRWDGMLGMGEMKMRLILRLVRSEDGKRVIASMDVPDQGAKDMPVGAVLYHAPDIRVELDAFRTSLEGTVSADGKKITGQFAEGPGGRPVSVVFTKNPKGNEPEEKPSFATGPGEKPDLRGYWRAMLPGDENSKQLIGLKIGRLKDGNFVAELDDYEHFAVGLPTSDVVMTNGLALLKWPMRGISLEAKLTPDANELGGGFKLSGNRLPITFKREAKPVTPFPEGTTFEPDPKSKADPRGEWSGVLSVGEQQLRLQLKLGRLPDASYAATMKSLDQGGQPILASSVVFTNSTLVMKYRAIGGTYTGTFAADGKTLEGNWEQGGGGKLKLDLVRGPSSDKASKGGAR